MNDDRRQHSRFPACWRARIICMCDHTGERKVMEGKTCNISVAGVCMLSQCNLCPDKALVVELSVPPVNPGASNTVAQFQGRSRFTVLSSKHGGFRTGIQFVGLSPQDRRDLNRYLEAHHGTRVPSEPSLCG